MRKTHTMHGQLPSDTVARFLVENDEVTLESGAGGGIAVRVPGRGPVTIQSLSELPAALDHLAVQPVRSQPDRRDFAPRGAVLRAAPGVDLYCVWSSNVDNVVAAGTREEMLAEGIPASRLARADLWGSSTRWPDMPEPYPIPYRAEGWDTETLVVENQDGMPDGRSGGVLPRAKLVDFLRAKLASDETAAGALLDPFEEDVDPDACEDCGHAHAADEPHLMEAPDLGPTVDADDGDALRWAADHPDGVSKDEIAAMDQHAAEGHGL